MKDGLTDLPKRHLNREGEGAAKGCGGDCAEAPTGTGKFILCGLGPFFVRELGAWQANFGVGRDQSLLTSAPTILESAESAVPFALLLLTLINI